MAPVTAEPRELVLLGGGHAHVQVLERWPRIAVPGVRVTLIDPEPRAIYSGMIPGFVAGQYREAELAIDLPALARSAGARFVRARALRIEAAARRVALDGAPDAAYDVASVDIGASVAGLDVPGVRAFAIPTRPIHGLVERFGGRAAAEPLRSRDGALRASVVGAGAGGVELAFALRERLRRAGERRPRVTLLDGAARILRGSPPGLARRASRLCGELGIALRLGAPVTAVERHGLKLADGSRLPSDLVIWVAGPAAPALPGASGLATDARGFLRVRSTLQALEHPELFCVGDAASLDAFPHTPKAGVYAVRAGPVLTRNLRAALTGSPLRAFRPQRDFLSLLNVCDGRALGAKWGASFEGAWVWHLKDRIDRGFVRRFRPTESG
ncbi:MAG: FAD-dependent oxidoreductase [Deltaproteobacteria bacterium]|nr:MAG: FAD-dependent oxidoreductase [Deltaproteobacteria bacterium]